MNARRSRMSMLVGAAALAVPASAGAAPTEPNTLVNPLFAPFACEFCHTYANAVPDLAEPAYSPFISWQGSMMANSARDPVFWAGVAVADQDSPGNTELCIRCHSPRAFLEGNGSATSIDQLTTDQQSGVECEMCHRAMEDLGTPAGNAQYTIDDVLIGTNVPRRGPWDYTDGNPEPPHEWIYDPYTGSSRLCGTCHDVTTPVERVDDDGNGLGVNFNEQRTYAEWLGSASAVPGPDFRSCQDCHMPPVEDMAACAMHINQQSHPVGGRRHDLAGANRFMVELLKQEYGSMGANLIADSYFDHTIDRIDELLPTAATLDIVAPPEVDLTVGLAGIGVTVTNNTGHKLPTGYSEGRVMWLEVVAEYGGEVVYGSGVWDQATGLQRDAQIRTYEAIGEELATGTTFHLLLNDHWVVDNRIPPLGLQPNIETDPVGDRYTLRLDGTWPNYDTHAYEFDAAPEIFDVTPEDPDDDDLMLTVRLRYLINTPEYIDFLGAEGAEAGANVATMFDLAGGATPVTITEATVPISIVAFGATAGTTSGSTTASDDTTTQGTTASDPDTTAGTPSDTTAMPPATTMPGTATGDGSSTGDGAGQDGGDGGCGCESGRPARPGLLLLLPFVLLGLRRRRDAARARPPARSLARWR